MIRILACEIKKNIICFPFLLSVLCSVLLCFTAGVYVDLESDQSYSIIESIFYYDLDFIKSDFSFSSIYVFSCGIDSYYFLMFIPVISSLAFLINYDNEIKSKYYYYEVYRASKNKMICSKFLSGILCGGVVVMLSYLIFGFLVYTIFPDINSYEIDEGLKDFLTKNNYWTTVVKTCMGGFFYGIVTAILTMVLYELANNIYISLSASFMIYYVYNSLLNKFLSDYETHTDLQFLYPGSLLYIFNGAVKPTLILFYSSITALAFGIYYFLSKRKLKLQ